MIVSVDSINVINDEVFVTAVIEDVVLVYPQTYFDPPEYGEAFCEASFCLDGETLPKDEEELIKYLELLDLDWKLLPKDWDY